MQRSRWLNRLACKFILGKSASKASSPGRGVDTPKNHENLRGPTPNSMLPPPPAGNTALVKGISNHHYPLIGVIIRAFFILFQREGRHTLRFSKKNAEKIPRHFPEMGSFSHSKPTRNSWVSSTFSKSRMDKSSTPVTNGLPVKRIPFISLKNVGAFSLEQILF